VVVTRAREQAQEMCALLEELGAEPIEFPAIAVVPPADCTPLDEAIAALDRYDWVVFTSVNGVRSFWDRLATLGKNRGALAGVHIAAIGPATARALRDRGVAADFVPAKYVAEEIAAGLGDVRGQRFLLPRADLAREALARLLREAGAAVDELVAYRTVAGEGGSDVRAMLQRGEIDAVTFTSSSTVRYFLQRIGPEATRLLDGVLIACIGPITARTAQQLGLHADVVAEEYTVGGLVRSLVEIEIESGDRECSRET
jgi:uroporphyrinogen III methyltransferase/synthase